MAFPAFQSLYMILAVDTKDGRGLSNTARHTCHADKEDEVDSVLAIEVGV